MGKNEHGRGSTFGRDLPPKGIQPRIVLGLLLAGSLAGIWVTHVADSLRGRTVTWLFVVAVGLLVGGLYWRVALFDRISFEHPEHRRYVQNRWDRIEAIAVWGATLSGGAYLAFGTSDDPSGIGGVSLATGLVCVSGLWIGSRYIDVSTRRKTVLRSGLLFLAFGSLGSFAWLETGTSLLDWMVRFGHVGAFALWIGGAVWHNFVVLPTVRARPDAAPPVKSQARKFRRHLPAVIALLVVTGSYQVIRLTGLSPPTLFQSLVGHLVVFKLFVLIVLTGLVIANYRRTT